MSDSIFNRIKAIFRKKKKENIVAFNAPANFPYSEIEKLALRQQCQSCASTLERMTRQQCGQLMAEYYAGKQMMQLIREHYQCTMKDGLTKAIDIHEEKYHK